MNNMPNLLGDKFASKFTWFPEQASTFAAENDWLFFFITWICVLFFVPIAGCLFYFCWKYSKPKGKKAESNTAHNTPLELAWSILPSFFLVAMFVMGARSYLNQRTVPEGANNIGLEAFRWGWTMDYGEGIMNPELHILVNEPTKLSMRSSDVIHSVFVPAFRAKKDVVPGRYNYMWFEADVASEQVPKAELEKAVKENEGRPWDFDLWQFTPDGYRFFDLYCTEYCGKNHSVMQTVVVVHKTVEDLDAWIEKVSSRPVDQTPEAWGEKLYNQRGCAGCHSLDGSKRVGPSFKESYGNMRPLAEGVPVIADEDYIRNSILYPKKQVVKGYQPVMPSYKGQLSDDDIASIIAYLKTVSDYGPKAASKTAKKEQSTEE
ncbi:cytochrome c oxidase subunit II [bacterium]|nr:cytochrome c oxidase subunit II [bacterium]